jgi:hypothetical protein
LFPPAPSTILHEGESFDSRRRTLAPEFLDPAVRALERELKESTPPGPNESLSLLEDMRERILSLHEREKDAAEPLRPAAS